MTSDHKLAACRSRLIHQLDAAKTFVTAVAPVVPDDDDDPLRQYLYKSTIMMVQSYFEEYLRCIISLGTFWRAPAVRAYFATTSPEQAEFYASMPAFQLGKEAQSRVSFENGATRLKALFSVISGGSPFADDDAERLCLDLAAVRNIIAHAGGWPTGAHVTTLRSPSVLVTYNDIGDSRFYRLRISRDFFGEALVGILRSVAAVEHRLVADPILKSV